MLGFFGKPKSKPKSIHDKDPPKPPPPDTPVMSEEDWKKYLDGLLDRMNRYIINYIEAYENEFIKEPAKIHLTGDPFIPMESLNVFAGFGTYMPSVVYGPIQTDTTTGIQFRLAELPGFGLLPFNQQFKNALRGQKRIGRDGIQNKYKIYYAVCQGFTSDHMPCTQHHNIFYIAPNTFFEKADETLIANHYKPETVADQKALNAAVSVPVTVTAASNGPSGAAGVGDIPLSPIPPPAAAEAATATVAAPTANNAARANLAKRAELRGRVAIIARKSRRFEFLEAAKTGNIRVLELLLRNGLVMTPELGKRALTYACEANQLEAARTLIDYGADPTGVEVAAGHICKPLLNGVKGRSNRDNATRQLNESRVLQKAAEFKNIRDRAAAVGYNATLNDRPNAPTKGTFYFTNRATGETIWELPSATPRTEWYEARTNENRVYYISANSEQTVWDLPPGGVVIRAPNAVEPNAVEPVAPVAAPVSNVKPVAELSPADKQSIYAIFMVKYNGEFLQNTNTAFQKIVPLTGDNIFYGRRGAGEGSMPITPEELSSKLLHRTIFTPTEKNAKIANPDNPDTDINVKVYTTDIAINEGGNAKNPRIIVGSVTAPLTFYLGPPTKLQRNAGGRRKSRKRVSFRRRPRSGTRRKFYRVKSK